MSEDLLSQGHTIGTFDGTNSQWIEVAAKQISFEIDDARCVNLADQSSRFYLRAEGLKFEFNYQDCILLQKCLS